jgi:hypothetical protein
LVLCGLQIFTLLVDKPLIFSLRNVKKTTLYSMVCSSFLCTIFIYDFLHEVYMELLLDLLLLFVNDASMLRWYQWKSVQVNLVMKMQHSQMSN